MFVAEAAQTLARNGDYEIPFLKKQAAKAQQQAGRQGSGRAGGPGCCSQLSCQLSAGSARPSALHSAGVSGIVTVAPVWQPACLGVATP